MVRNEKSNYEVYNNSIFILESLKDETQTGKWLYEDLKAYTYKFDFFKIEYLQFLSKKEFWDILGNINDSVQKDHLFPAIHLEAHGDQEGLQIAESSEEIKWRELNNYLSKINFACRNNLILSMGVCNGHYINIDLVDVFESISPCPFHINISPISEIGSYDIKLSYSNFYHSLITNKDFGLATINMNEITNLNILSSAGLFADKMLTELKDNSLSERKLVELLDKKYSKGQQPLPGKNYNRNLKALKREYKTLKRDVVKRRWEKFLMIDTYEENEGRFGTFEEIWSSIK